MYGKHTLNHGSIPINPHSLLSVIPILYGHLSSFSLVRLLSFFFFLSSFIFWPPLVSAAKFHVVQLPYYLLPLDGNTKTTLDTSFFIFSYSSPLYTSSPLSFPFPLSRISICLFLLLSLSPLSRPPFSLFILPSSLSSASCGSIVLLPDRIQSLGTPILVYIYPISAFSLVQRNPLIVCNFLPLFFCSFVPLCSSSCSGLFTFLLFPCRDCHSSLSPRLMRSCQPLPQKFPFLCNYNLASSIHSSCFPLVFCNPANSIADAPCGDLQSFLLVRSRLLVRL